MARNRPKDDWMDLAIAGVVMGVVVSVVVVMNGWSILLIRNLRAEMGQQHQDLLVRLVKIVG